MARPRTMMKKVAIFAVAAVALVLLALPPVLGMLTESTVRARVAALDMGVVLKPTVPSYERGWFQSRARVSLALAPETIARLDQLGAAPRLAPPPAAPPPPPPPPDRA